MLRRAKSDAKRSMQLLHQNWRDILDGLVDPTTDSVAEVEPGRRRVACERSCAVWSTERGEGSGQKANTRQTEIATHVLILACSCASWPCADQLEPCSVQPLAEATRSSLRPRLLPGQESCTCSRTSSVSWFGTEDTHCIKHSRSLKLTVLQLTLIETGSQIADLSQQID